MYRDFDPNAESSEPEQQAAPRPGRRFAPTPMGIFSGLLALTASFFGLFLLSWGVSPTSIGCGSSRSLTMVVAQLAISLTVLAVVLAVGLGWMREAREPQLRVRSYVITASTIFAIGVIPQLAFAALVGSCFDF